MDRSIKAAPQQMLLVGDLLQQARRELTRLSLIRGRGRRTARRIAAASSQFLLAATLLGGMGSSQADAQCQSHFVNTFGVPDIGYRSHPALADIDGDGDLDLFVGDEFDYLMWFFENTGSAAHPQFAPARRDPFGQGDQSYLGAVFSPALVDIDGDGDLDAFVGNSVGETYFIENVGTASEAAFSPAVLNPLDIPLVDVDSVPRFVDIDGDKDFDLFIGGDDRLLFLQNFGTPKRPGFAAPVETPFGLSEVDGPAVPAFVDIDNDGDADLFVGDYAGDVIFFENIGTAKIPLFAPPITNPFGFVRLSTLGDDAGFFSAPTFADIDGDGDFDAFIGDYRGYTFFFENLGTAATPHFRAPMVDPFGLDPASYVAAPAFVDIDGDGDLDAVVSTYDTHEYFRNDGTAADPSFSDQGSNPFGLTHPDEFAKLSFVDIDGDGDSDAFFRSSFFLNIGSSTTPNFNPPVTNPFGLASDEDTPNFVDIDGDGDLDAFSGSAPIRFSRNVGTASAPAFSPPLSNPFNLNPPEYAYGSPEFLDVDGDGDLDATVVVQTYLDGYFRYASVLFENTGSATFPHFAPPVPISFGFADRYHASSLSFADIDGDGDLDGFAGRRPETGSGPRDYSGPIIFLRNESLCGVRCSPQPLSDCTEAVKAKVRIQRGVENELLWQWGRATADKAVFGNPVVGTPLALCLYEDQSLAASTVIPPGGTCAGSDCWKDLKKGYRFKDAGGTGIASVKLREGAGKAKILVRGEGTQLAVPALPLAPEAALTLQLVNPRSEGTCWESTFTAPAARNDFGSYKARTP